MKDKDKQQQWTHRKQLLFPDEYEVLDKIKFKHKEKDIEEIIEEDLICQTPME